MINRAPKSLKRDDAGLTVEIFTSARLPGRHLVFHATGGRFNRQLARRKDDDIYLVQFEEQRSCELDEGLCLWRFSPVPQYFVSSGSRESSWWLVIFTPQPVDD